MSAANGGGNGQAPTQAAASAGGNGQAPATAPANNDGSPSAAPHGQAPTAIDPQSQQLSADDAKRIRQELDEARRDAARYRDELKKRDDASLTEQQKRERDFTDLQTKAYEYEASLQRLHLENAGLRLAPALGIADPALALAAVWQEHEHEVKYGADGRPENLSDLLKQVLKDHPQLAVGSQRQQTPPSSGGPSNPGRQAGNGGLTREIINAMPMRERMARISELDAWEKAQRQQS